MISSRQSERCICCHVSGSLSHKINEQSTSHRPLWNLTSLNSQRSTSFSFGDLFAISYSADTNSPVLPMHLGFERKKKIFLVPMRRKSCLSILPRRCEVIGCVSLRFLLPFDHPTFRSATCDTRFKSRQVIHHCPCLRYEAAPPIKTNLTGASVNAVSFLPFFPFLIFIPKCGMMRLPWSQFGSLPLSEPNP